ncbi:hypothetical protein H9Q16_19940 [Sulfitobacter sp. TSTF-M16]|uniref:Response regulatory domain-containing protein n=2 Tax=Sulfitobacter aestuariivivens TaxID=2766981 RepID=A0A927D9N2_9RHOB|nr:hypothetical protein [Sulfitobacter aestuariivivens]MBD3666212.1 hypothetical protein [Sulfitobacter aestuariivivens]
MITKLRVNEVNSDPSVPTADVIVVDFDEMGEDELQIFAEVRAKAPETPLILVSEELTPDAMRQLFKYNVQDWLRKPIDDEGLLSAIRSTVRSSRTTTNQVNAVISCVGGAGATTLAINMADIASRRLAKKDPNIALVDLDFSTGNCSYVLNMVSTFNLGSVASAPRRVDSEFVSVIQQQHDSGFYLYSFKRPDLNTELNGYELILRLLDVVSLEHTTLFLDIPYYATEWRNDVLSAVNTVTLVSEVNLPAIKHTLDQIEQIKELRGEDFPIHVVFNKHSGRLFGQRISSRRIKELLEDTPFTYLPADHSLIGEATDRGVLPSDISTRAQFLKKLTGYMKSANMMGAPAK